MFKTKSAAAGHIGGLSAPSKMPGPSFSISALQCQTGARLREVAGSVCADCYACKGNYVWPNVKAAHARRLESVMDALSGDEGRAKWVAAFVTLLAGVPHFRWHDSGDLQSVEHFALIVAVCEATPNTRHWLPTKEPRYVKRYAGALPENLVVRVSAPMIDTGAPQGFANSSVVHKHKAPQAGAHVCPAPAQGGKCGDCRACWNRDVAVVSYHAH